MERETLAIYTKNGKAMLTACALAALVGVPVAALGFTSEQLIFFMLAVLGALILTTPVIGKWRRSDKSVQSATI